MVCSWLVGWVMKESTKFSRYNYMHNCC